MNDAGGRTAVAALWHKYRTKQPGAAIIRNGRIGSHEENWVPLIRSLDAFTAAYFRVHHFAQQLASPFPLLAAVGAKTRKIEIGTAVIDMRYENPHYMVEDAGAADLISGGRLQLGISRGSPEQVIDGWRYFGYRPIKGEDDEGMGRRHAEEFLELLRGKGFAQPNPRPGRSGLSYCYPVRGARARARFLATRSRHFGSCKQPKRGAPTARSPPWLTLVVARVLLSR
ncbi:MAG: luciferase-like [Acidobacteriaceae bacterium]|nr:luciferase-like [Acidobacteriaceae bacterium]